jgi:hypothetical protein
MLRKGPFTVLLYFLAPWLASAGVQEKSSEVPRILFAGNSYTFFWNMPKGVEFFGGDQGYEVRTSTAGGANWEHHLQSELGLQTMEIIARGDWDFVVLQNESRSTIDRPQAFQENGERLLELIKERGAVPLLFSTWARKHDSGMLETVTKGYAQLGRKTQTKVIPVGQVWAFVLQARPDLELYAQDGSHPSALGSYLTALVFYKFFSGSGPLAVSHRPTYYDCDGEKQYVLMVDKADANALCDLVDRYDESFLRHE